MNFRGSVEKEKSSSSKKVVGGLAIATTIALAIYALKTGKLGRLKNVTGGTKPVTNTLQNEVTNINSNAIDDVINNYADRAKKFIRAEGAPVITQLKNGKQKIEFLGKCNRRAIIVCDKSGKVEKLIEFTGKSYNVFDGVNVYQSKFLKSCLYKKTGVNSHSLVIEKPFDFKTPDDPAEFSRMVGSKPNWKKNIDIRSNDKVANITTQDWLIPYHQGPAKEFAFDIYKNSNAPADVIKEIRTCRDKVEYQAFKYKAGMASSAKEVPVEVDKQGLSPQQLADMRELFNIKS